MSIQQRISSTLRQVPDFPKPGINFYDITPLLKDAPLFRDSIEVFSQQCRSHRADAIVGIEARGFIFGAALALELGLPFVPVRKPGKLPAEVERLSYDLEYGSDALEIHRDALGPGHRIVVVDDLIATGGTAMSSIRLVEKLGGTVVEFCCVIELAFLKGRERLKPVDVFSIVTFDS